MEGVIYKICLFCRFLEDINIVLEYVKFELSDVKLIV